MKKTQVKKSKELAILLIALFLISSFANFLPNTHDNLGEKSNIKPKISATNLDIMINDLLTTNTTTTGNWTWARTQPWCTQGAGTPGDPYIIEDETFIYNSIGPESLRILNSRENFIIRDCVITDSLLAGVFLNNVTNGQILNNDVVDNGYGIVFIDVNDTTVSDNNISIYSNSGLLILGDSDNNVISGNTINGNGADYGIEVMTGSDNNLFYDNYVTNHAINNALDYGANNDWNNSVIGNYWDDYTGYDMDLDGIGDDPYSITGSAGNFDFLPIWNIQGPIAIDDLPSSLNNWTWAASQAWCSGSGTSGDPYVIENLTIDGNSTDSCIAVQNSNKDFIVRNCKVYNSGTGMFVSGILLLNVTKSQIIGNNASTNNLGITLIISEYNTISGNNVNQNTQYGIILVGGHNNTVSGNTANENLVNDGILLGGSHNNTVTGNTCNNNSGYGIFLGDSNFNSLSENILNNNSNSGIWIETSHNNTIIGTTTNYNENNGIYSVDSNNNTIEDTNAHYNKYNGIYLQNSNKTRILENELSDNIENGIKIENSYENWIEGTITNNNGYNGIYNGWGDDNTFKDTTAINNGHNGIYIQVSNNNFILENSLSESTENGIKVEGSLYNLISENLAFTNGLDGIFLVPGPGTYSDYNNITENYIYNNTGDGIDFINSRNNIIWNNIIRENNDTGVHLDVNCLNNLFYKNFFLKNVKHVIDETLNNNDWNSTTIGNYWDNYTGPDTIPPYGIGDIPYNISLSPLIQDFLPIVDDQPPSIIINSPNPGDVFGISAPSFIVTVTDDYLDEMWYTLDGGLSNHTFTENGTIIQSVWDAIPDGVVTLKFYASDNPGNIGSAEVIIEKDSQAPIITINIPITGDTFGASAPNFAVEITDDNLDSMWYSLDGGLTNFTFTVNGTIDQTAWAALSEGSVTITFYANDTLGNLASETVNVEKDIEPPGNNFIIIIIVIFIVTGAVIITVVIVIVLRKRRAGEEV